MKYDHTAQLCTRVKPDGTTEQVAWKDLVAGDTVSVMTASGALRNFHLGAKYKSPPGTLDRAKAFRAGRAQAHPMPEKVKLALAAWHEAKAKASAAHPSPRRGP